MAKPIEILLVEDSPADITLTQEALKDMGIETHLSIVNDGEEAVDYLRRRGKYTAALKPDIMLLDLNMPRKDGHEVLAEMKGDPDLETIPVILLTVSRADEDISKALDLKMNYYLNKPVTSRNLKPILTEIHTLWART